MCSETRCRVCREGVCKKAVGKKGVCGLGSSFTYGEYLEWKRKKTDGKDTGD